MTYFMVKDKVGSFVWAGMAKDASDALDKAARSRQLGSYRYAVAMNALERDEWTATVKPWRLCQIYGHVNGEERELIAAPITSLADIDRLQNEIPDSDYESVDEKSIRYRWIG